MAQTPPSEWGLGDRVSRADDSVYYLTLPPPSHPVVFHYCSTYSRWHACGTEEHAISSRDPLTIATTLYWLCCGMRGHIDQGKWVA